MNTQSRDPNEDTSTPASFPSTPPQSSMPEWYSDLLESVSSRVATGRGRAVAAANQQLVATYWAIGRDILGRQEMEGWGSKVIDRLSRDLRQRFPAAKGFSPRNLKYMRAFAEAWPDQAIVQRRVAQLPWRHNVALLEKVDDVASRLWYADKALEEGWSRDVLVHQIETRLHERQGRAVTNFEATMPPSDSDLAQHLMKDPYVFDFVAMTDRRDERELETRLVDHVQKFLLELGQGFAFVGEQVRLRINSQEFFADLLFYNFKLRGFVVIELKGGDFKPDYLGQLGMYMSAVDDVLAQSGDKPTIGLLLCKSKDSVVAEYALRGYSTPIGVAEWKTKIVESLPEELESSLPSIDELEAELTRTSPWWREGENKP